MSTRLPSPPPGALRAEARTLFALAESAAENGLFAESSLADSWRALAARCAERTPLEEAAPELHALLEAALRTRDVKAGWIGERWQALEARLRSRP